jgi:hypothetical protein
LRRLQSEGRVVDFELLVDIYAISVMLSEADEGRSALQELDGVAALLSADEEGSACAEGGARAVRYSLAAVAAMRGLESQTASRVGVQATNPSIGVHVSPSEDYGSVYGSTDPNTTVSMLLRSASGAVKVAETTTSSSSGSYYFYPDWHRCGRYDWYPVPGDIVEVTAAGNMVTTVVVDVAAFADPTTDTVTGVTAPNRSIQVGAYETYVVCEWAWHYSTTTSDSGGNFAANIAEGFDRSIHGVYVYVYDGNDNYTYTYTYPPRLVISYDGDVSGYLKPRVHYTAALKRGESTIASISGKTQKDGGFENHFIDPATVEAGDVIEVSGGGLVISNTFVEVGNLTFDLVNDRITGTAGPEAIGHRVRISPDRSWWYDCGWEYGCAVDTVDSDGSFDLDFTADGFDLRRGDDDYSPEVYDSEGNYQEFRGTLVVPVIEVEPYDDDVYGYWPEPGVVVTMTLQDPAGIIRDVDTDTTSTYDADFYGHFGLSVEPGDSVEVGDGSHTLTVSSVPTLTSYLEADSDTVTGNGPEGSTLVVKQWHRRFDPAYGSVYYGYCRTTTVSGDRYTVDFTDEIDVRAQDDTYVYHSDPDDHKVGAYSHAFEVNAEEGGDYLNGYTPEPNSEVGMELWRAESLQAVVTTTSSGSGYYYGHLASGTPVTITQGDMVTVRVQGLVTYSLPIPELTAQEDPAHNQVKGRAPAASTIEVHLDQRPTYRDWFVQAVSDADGNYVADFSRALGRDDCMEAEVGACTRPQATYYNDDGHTVYVWGPEAPPVLADAYEPDDVPASASPYEGIQSHTFHGYYDADWITLTVAADEVGMVHTLKTVNLGLNANTELHLYDTNGITLLASDTSYRPAASEIVWTPPDAGTYYVKVEPYFSSYAVDCGSTYDFFIAQYRLYLPVAMRDW